MSAYELPGDRVFPEGIAVGGDGRTFYVSGARDGAIYRGDVERPVLEVWQPPGVDGRDRATGMAIDDRGRLLVCGWTSGCLYAFDTATGEACGVWRAPAEKPALNDVAVHGGHAYVTDSGEPVIWRLALGDEPGEPGKPGKPERWLDLGEQGASREAFAEFLNGIVATPDGRSLVVAAQATGVLWRIDLATTKAERVPLDTPVNGDGLAYVGDTLYICDNTDEPDGSVRYWLTAVDVEAGVLLGRWERPHDDSPTTLAEAQGRLLLVNSQFAADRHGRARAPFTISALAPPREESR
jgi:sugar lactone lactonase YvrE